MRSAVTKGVWGSESIGGWHLSIILDELANPQPE